MKRVDIAKGTSNYLYNRVVDMSERNGGKVGG